MRDYHAQRPRAQQQSSSRNGDVSLQELHSRVIPRTWDAASRQHDAAPRPCTAHRPLNLTPSLPTSVANYRDRDKTPRPPPSTITSLHDGLIQILLPVASAIIKYPNEPPSMCVGTPRTATPASPSDRPHPRRLARRSATHARSTRKFPPIVRRETKPASQAVSEIIPKIEEAGVEERKGTWTMWAAPRTRVLPRVSPLATQASAGSLNNVPPCQEPTNACILFCFDIVFVPFMRYFPLDSKFGLDSGGIETPPHTAYQTLHLQSL